MKSPVTNIIIMHWASLMAQWVKNPSANAEDVSSIPGSAGSPGGGNDNPLQYSCLENSEDRIAWWATVHGVAKDSDTTQQLNNNTLAPESV